MSYRLRHRISIQKPVRAQDPASGGTAITWEDVYIKVPAEVLTGAGKENVSSGATQNETSARINMRWLPIDRLDILTYRGVWDGTIFQITGAETDVTDRREWRLTCSSGVTDGR